MRKIIHTEPNMHPMLKGRENQLILERLQAEMRNQGMQYLVLTNSPDCFYATGYLTIIIPDYTVVVVPAEGRPTMFTSLLDSLDAASMAVETDVAEYPSWVFIDDGTEESRKERGENMDPAAAVHMALDLIKEKPLKGKVGLQFFHATYRFYQAFTESLPEGSIVNGEPLLSKVRAIKTPWEVDMLRHCAQQCDAVYQAVAAEVKPGMPAYKMDALFTYYSAKINLEYGTMGRFHTFFPSVGPYYGQSYMQRGYILKKGDIVKFDGGFKYLGYDCDLARTFAVGGAASNDAIEIYDALYKANRIGVEMLKPGVKLGEIYKAVRTEVEKCRLIPNWVRGHVGHGIGCSDYAEEFPKIAPNSDIVLQPNMVFALETPWGGTGKAPVIGGFNLEDTHAITEDGHDSFAEVPDNIFYRV